MKKLTLFLAAALLGRQLCCVRKFRRVFLHSAGANGHPG